MLFTQGAVWEVLFEEKDSSGLYQEEDKTHTCSFSSQGRITNFGGQGPGPALSEGQDSTHLTGERGLTAAISGNGIEATKKRGGGRTLNPFSK